MDEPKVNGINTKANNKDESQETGVNRGKQ